MDTTYKQIGDYLEDGGDKVPEETSHRWNGKDDKVPEVDDPSIDAAPSFSDAVNEASVDGNKDQDSDQEDSSLLQNVGDDAANVDGGDTNGDPEAEAKKQEAPATKTQANMAEKDKDTAEDDDEDNSDSDADASGRTRDPATPEAKPIKPAAKKDDSAKKLATERAEEAARMGGAENLAEKKSEETNRAEGSAEEGKEQKTEETNAALVQTQAEDDEEAEALLRSVGDDDDLSNFKRESLVQARPKPVAAPRATETRGSFLLHKLVKGVTEPSEDKKAEEEIRNEEDYEEAKEEDAIAAGTKQLESDDEAEAEVEGETEAAKGAEADGSSNNDVLAVKQEANDAKAEEMLQKLLAEHN